MKPSIAIAGTGYWGKNLVRCFHQLGALRTIHDPDDAACRQMAGEFPGVSTVVDFQTLLEDPQVTGVIVASPAVTHHELAKRALLAGKHVFVEKPLALREEDGRELVELSRKVRRVLFVGHLLHYHSAVIRLKRLIREGVIGKLEYIYSNRLSLGKIRREENILWSFAPHDISLIMDLVGEVPDQIDSVGLNFLDSRIADMTMSHFTFPSGVAAHIFVSWLHPFKEQRLVVTGDKGMFVFEDTLPMDRKLMHYPHRIQWINQLPVPERAEGIAIDLTADWREPLMAECEAFLEALTSGKPPITDGEEGLRVLQVLNRCQEKIEEKLQHARQRGETAVGGVGVHESAYVHPEAEVGEGTVVWHFSQVMKGARLGKNCNLGQNVNIAPGVWVGDGVKIQNNVSLYTGTRVEDDVFLGPSCVLTNVSNPRSEISRRGLYEKTVIRRGATIGANATVLCGIEIGRFAFVAAGAVVTKNVPDYALVAGNPARQAGWMSRHGQKLARKNNEDHLVCPESGYRYQEVAPGLLRCLDLDEEAPLPGDQRTSKTRYRDFKNIS